MSPVKQAETQIEFEAPVRIESEMNRRDHWTVRRKRFNAQSDALWKAWLGSPHRGKGLHQRMDFSFPLPAVVTLTRIGPRRLDSDNLASGFKQIRDTLTRLAFYDVDDGDERITWMYQQERGKPKDYRIRIRIEHLPIPY